MNGGRTGRIDTRMMGEGTEGEGVLQVCWVIAPVVSAPAIKCWHWRMFSKTVWTGDARDQSMIKTDEIQCLTSSFIRFIPAIRGSDNVVNQLRLFTCRGNKPCRGRIPYLHCISRGTAAHSGSRTIRSGEGWSGSIAPAVKYYMWITPLSEPRMAGIVQVWRMKYEGWIKEQNTLNIDGQDIQDNEFLSCSSCISM